MLGYGLTKTKHLVLTGQIRSVKDGGNRRILPEWVDEYIRHKVEEHERMSRRHNGEGSIYPVKDGYRGYVWCTNPAGDRYRKYVKGKTYEDTQAAWLKLRDQASRGPVASDVPTLEKFLHVLA